MPRPLASQPASSERNILVSFVHQLSAVKAALMMALAMANSNANAWAIIGIINNACCCCNVLIYYVTLCGNEIRVRWIIYGKIWNIFSSLLEIHLGLG